MSTTADRTALLGELELAYQTVKRTTRGVRAGDRLYEDLEVDSLAALELLIELEERHGVELVNDPRSASLRTVDDVLDMLALRDPAGASPAADAPPPGAG